MKNPISLTNVKEFFEEQQRVKPSSDFDFSIAYSQAEIGANTLQKDFFYGKDNKVKNGWDYELVKLTPIKFASTYKSGKFDADVEK